MAEVCVTGGTGFIASHIINILLQRGYKVRTTVRNPDDAAKVSFLWNLPGAQERLSIFKADLLEEGSFKDAFSGVDGVFHVASPVLVANWEGPESLGTMFERNYECAQLMYQCKKIILTSSCSSVRYDYNRKEDDPPLDESNWSNVDYCKEYKLWYAWAKTLGEKEAWRFAKEKKLDLVVINPSFVIGPILSNKPSSTIAIVLGILKGHLKTYPNSRMGYVHIHDVALSHVLTFENTCASGRFICSGDVYHWSDIISMLQKKYPNYPITNICAQEMGNDIPHKMNTSKLKSIGMETFIGIEEMFDDCIESLKSHGLLE